MSNAETNNQDTGKTTDKSIMQRLTGIIFSFGSLMFVLGIIFWLGFGIALDATNQLDFCISCHSMKMKSYSEYQESVHYKNRVGVRASCADCHVPKEIGPKLLAKFMAYKDTLHEILGTIDTPEKYESQRLAMANRVWAKMKERDSKECRNCHKLEAMNLTEQSKTASKKHAKLIEGNSDKTCVDCHKGIAHKLPEDEPKTDAPDAPKT